MIYIVLTYNIDNATNRASFVEQFEKILTDFGLHKEASNQSTYFGHYSTPANFSRELFNAASKLQWSALDSVTIYYPTVTPVNGKNVADIGRLGFRISGNNLFNWQIYK